MLESIMVTRSVWGVPVCRRRRRGRGRASDRKLVLP
jgi:hypothetical protein